MLNQRIVCYRPENGRLQEITPAKTPVPCAAIYGRALDRSQAEVRREIREVLDLGSSRDLGVLLPDIPPGVDGPRPIGSYVGIDPKYGDPRGPVRGLAAWLVSIRFPVTSLEALGDTREGRTPGI